MCTVSISLLTCLQLWIGDGPVSPFRGFQFPFLVSHSIPLLEWPTPAGTLGSIAGRNKVTKVNPCPYEDWSIQWKRRQGSNLKVFIRELSFRLCRSQLRSNHFKSILLPAYGPTAFLYVWLVGFTYLASLSNGRWVLTLFPGLATSSYDPLQRLEVGKAWQRDYVYAVQMVLLCDSRYVCRSSVLRESSGTCEQLYSVLRSYTI